MPILPPRFDDAQRERDRQRQIGDQKIRQQLIPPLCHQSRPVQALSVSLDGYQDITSATFVTCWDTIMDRIVHRGLFVAIPWQTGVGTTGELKVTAFGFYSTSAVALAANSSGIQTFRWLHGQTPWITTDISFEIQARRTGGAGNVRTGPPYSGFVQVDPRDCTLTGI